MATNWLHVWYRVSYLTSFCIVAAWRSLCYLSGFKINVINNLFYRNNCLLGLQNKSILYLLMQWWSWKCIYQTYNVIVGIGLPCFHSVADDSSRFISAMEDTLSKDELRMRLFNTFKNKGVLDKLKVSHIPGTYWLPGKCLNFIFVIFWSRLSCETS